MAILVDANIFCAFANSDDVYHKQAVSIMQDVIKQKYGKVITTDYVFDEAVTVTLRRSNKKNAIEIGTFLLNSEIFIAKTSSEVFEQAWTLFQKEGMLSFTDCSLLSFMKTFGIQKIATFDKEFLKRKDIEVIRE